jgi:hypothetical protein
MKLLDFDPDFYLRINHDVRAAGLDPFKHWVDNGRFEGRAVSRAMEVKGLKRLDGQQVHQAGKRTVMVVSHEASRTGAPVLALNLVRRLKHSHNVVVLLLKDGPLTPDFASESTTTYVMADNHFWSAAIAPHKIKVQHPEISAAFVNSVVSFPVVSSLKVEGIKVISLIHEFASYIKPASILGEMLLDSNVVIFSAPIIHKDAVRLLGDLGSAQVVILPQGKCDVSEEPKPLSESSMKIKQTLIAQKGSRQLVLGGGTVNIRKGVDLFIQAAATFKSRHPDQPVLFAWAGHGFDPEKDLGYSVYLEDQIRRSGLEDSFTFLGELDDINVAYELSDVFWLTSRLDPLPNVGIDAICLGLPIVCFENASGIADVLVAAGMTSTCVAGYVDVDGLVTRTAALLQDDGLRQRVSSDLKKLGAERFSFDRYAVELKELV